MFEKSDSEEVSDQKYPEQEKVNDQNENLLKRLMTENGTLVGGL